MFQNELHDYLITKLNLNTKDLTFSGDYMFGINDGKFIIETQTDFIITETEFIPTMVQDWRNTVQPYKRIDLQDLVIPLSLAIRQTQLDDAWTAIEEFRVFLNGASDTIDGLNVGFRVGQPSSQQTAKLTTGERWVMVDIIIMLSAGTNLLYGNAIEFKMAKTTETLVELVYSSLDITTTAENNTTTADFVSTTKNSKSIETIHAVIFFEDNVTLMDEFVDWLWQVTINDQFDISLKYTATDTRTATVRIISMVQHIEAGVPVGFDMTLVKAS